MLESLVRSTISSVPVPHMGKPNLVLTYAIVAGMTEIDPLTGNEVDATKPIVVTASVRKSDRTAIENQSAGSDTYTMPIEGRLVSPKQLPKEIAIQTIAKATLDGMNGEFRLMPVAQHRSTEFTKHRGAYIEGIFTVKGSA